MSKDKSLVKWLLSMIICGTILMSFVIAGVSMALYMRSVKRIYKTEMLKSAEAAIELVGKDKLEALCLDAFSEKAKDPENKERTRKVLLQVYQDAGLTDLVLYAFDDKTLEGTAIVVAFDDDVSEGDRVSFGKRELHRLLNGEATRIVEKNADGTYENTVFKAVTDKSGSIIGLIKISSKLRDTFDSRIRFLFVYVPLIVLLLVAFSFISLRMFQKRIINPITEITQAANSYGARDMMNLDSEEGQSFTIPVDVRNDELGVLWNTCHDMEASIKESIIKLKTVTAEKERQAAEISAAAQIQNGMLPTADPAIDEHKAFSIFGSMTPAKGVGGDLYDYFLIDDDHLAMVVGDVSGKGMPAALFMVLVISQIRMNSKKGMGPAEILKAANTVICANNPEMMFATVWMGIYEISTKTMRECNAGHEDCAIRRAGGRFEFDIKSHDTPLGIMDDMDLTEFSVAFNSGDELFVYTDGVPEAADVAEAQYSPERLLECLNEKSGLSNEETVGHVLDSIRGFVAYAPQFDDITMLSFTVR